MSVSRGNDEDTTTHTDEYYEELASQEQRYLDEIEERLRESFTFTEPNASPNDL